MWAAILYFVTASLLTITFWGACTSRYRKDLLLTASQRTLMLQSILLLIYLLLGAYIFSEIESWHYLDAVYWTVVTLFTVGFGDYYPVTDLGRSLLIPFALAGIISLGLVISSVRNLIVENGSRCVAARIDDRKRRKMIRNLLLGGDNKALEPIVREFQTSFPRSKEPCQSEFERRKAEFDLMRKIQAKSSTRRRWVAMAISTFSWLVLWLVGALVFEQAEKHYQGWSYFDAFYFCFEAWTTIGYGDLAPISNGGRSFYVFWSLLALPTMTVLISNASNTVVRIIRDVTILVGNITILPNDRDFFGNLKSLISKITFGNIFPNQESGSSIPMVRLKNIDRKLAGTTTELPESSRQNDWRGSISASVAGKLVSPITDPRNTWVQSLSTSGLPNGPRVLPTGTDFQLLLISEIQAVICHLKESKPHHYPFDQWAWYLKLIGEDEHSPLTHCKVNLDKAQADINEDDPDTSLKWSWIGYHSPLLSTQEESEWILGRLMDKLQKSLLVVRGWQPNNASRMSLPETWQEQVLNRDGCIGSSR
jgi:potassium channel subfamily K